MEATHSFGVGRASHPLGFRDAASLQTPTFRRSPLFSKADRCQAQTTHVIRERVVKDLDFIYFAARELPPEGRRAYLTKVCGEDKALRARVEQMLAVASEAEAFIADLPDGESEDQTPGRELVETLKPDPADTPDEVIGEKIGRYKIL